MTTEQTEFAVKGHVMWPLKSSGKKRGGVTQEVEREREEEAKTCGHGERENYELP